MEHMQAKILRYSELSPAEQREVEAYVSEHPDLQPLLEEARRLGPFLKHARLLMKEPISDEMLVYYAVVRLTEKNPASPALQKIIHRIEARLAETPTLRERYEVFLKRARSLEASSDATVQFEALTGHSLDAFETAPPKRRDRRQARSWHLMNALPRSVRWALTAVLLLLFSYALLYLVGQATQPALERLASIEPGEMQLEGYRLQTRGSRTAADTASTDALYLRARAALQDARTSTLGLFPGYDEEQLQEAARHLERVVAREEPNSFLQLEAYYLLGKVHLAQGDAAEAQEALKRVVQGQGRQAPEAARLLERIYEITSN